MDDLTRLFRLLVARIAEDDPDRLASAFQVSEMYQRFVPYRRYKADLGFESVEDYEMALLRLLAGERELARVEPDDAREQLAAEADAVAPNTGFFREFAAARVTLSRAAVLECQGDEAYRPPQTPEAPTIPPPAAAPATREGAHEPKDVTAAAPIFEAVMESTACSHCRGDLPTGRKANFCPHCGSVLGAAVCTSCGEPIEETWHFCLGCGRPLRRE